jgi:hypothetical protein
MLKGQELASEKDLVALTITICPYVFCNKINAWKVKLANKRNFKA